MYCNEDLERFYFKYQSEALSHGQSLQSFCWNNNESYNLFSKWYKDTRRKFVAVQVVYTCPSALCREESVQSVPVAFDDFKLMAAPSTLECEMSDKPVRIWLELHISNGLYVSRKNKLSGALQGDREFGGFMLNVSGLLHQWLTEMGMTISLYKLHN